MSDTKNPGDKKLGVGSKTLTLKRGVEQGTVRQSFSHGRSKQVVVEKVKRRVIGAPTDAKPEAAPVPEPAAPGAVHAEHGREPSSPEALAVVRPWRISSSVGTAPSMTMAS